MTEPGEEYSAKMNRSDCQQSLPLLSDPIGSSVEQFRASVGAVSPICPCGLARCHSHKT
jgi:hypothetical protein